MQTAAFRRFKPARAANLSFRRSIRPAFFGSGAVGATVQTTFGFQSQRLRSRCDTICAVWPQAWMMSGRNCFAACTSSPKAPREKRCRDKDTSCTGTPFCRSTAAGTALGDNEATWHFTRCFGMRVSVAARLGTPRAEVPANRMHFDDLLEQADVLSLHCPLNAATKHMIGAPQLKHMKRDALLINTARGGLIDSEALAAALRAGQIGGAGIDVLESEPPPADDPLLAPDIPNLIVTPHVAWTAREARQRALDQVTENIADFLRGGTLRRLV